MNLANQKILVTGADGFIGSHLTETLIDSGYQVKAFVYYNSFNSWGWLDSFSKDKLDKIEIFTGDIRDPNGVKTALKDVDIVFHLACDHGGRGYVDLHQGATSSNFLLDGSVFWASLQARVVKVVFASSGCVYPNFLQTDPKKTIYLKEEMVTPPYDADNMYGWGKLMGELTLKAFFKDYGTV